MNKKNILHITPHLGGGVGRVILNYLGKVKDDSAFKHKVLCLDFANKNAVRLAGDIGLALMDNMANKKQKLLKMLAGADIVLIHWWNHPLLYDFLVRTQLPPCRLIMWSHISGFHPPSVFTNKILRYPDLFVFTTPVSYGAKEVKNLSDERKKLLRAVWSTGGVEHARSVKPKAHAGFNVGYVGTVDYCKMHPDFLVICSRVDIPDVNFIVCGGPKEKELKREAEKLGIIKKFNFTGLVPDISKYLSLFDVFGYPLAPYHYGTCDQVLAECMAAGIVPVVMSNRMESYMVKDGVTGIIAKNQKEYVKAIENLYFNKNQRSYLSLNAKKYAHKTFSLEIIRREWEKIFTEILAFPKTAKKWEIGTDSSKISAKDVFLEALGDYGKDFISYCDARSNGEKIKYAHKIKKLAESAAWQAETKGTVHHYHSFFNDDIYLSQWSKIMEPPKKNYEK